MKRPLLFQNQPAFEIATGDGKVLISADHGARILRWENAGREIITWPDDADWTHVLKIRGGNPVLFPFVARHFVDGKNELWKDAEGNVRRMPQHGFCRDAKFTVIDDEPDTLRMRLTDWEETRAFYPFNFQFDVVVKLSAEAKLEIRFETTNTGSHPLPYYAGHHFYFAIPHRERADWNLHLPCTAWGRQAADGAIVREPALQDDVNLAIPRPLIVFRSAPRKTRSR